MLQAIGQWSGCLGFCLISHFARWEVFAQSLEHTTLRVAPNVPSPFLSCSLFTKQQLRTAIIPTYTLQPELLNRQSQNESHLSFL